MDLRINHSCPSCGAPIEMKEADRLTTCAFCDGRNYMVSSGLLRFVLPDAIPERIPREDILYFPYLRFKGNVYLCQGSEVDGKVLDTTHQGLAVRMMPPSLGLRPQAMKVHLVSEKHVGRFLKRKESAVAILQRASLLASAIVDPQDEPLYHRAFIGETVSCIYLPLYLDEDQVYDGVLNRQVGRAEPWLSDTDGWVRYRPEWEPIFLSTICPQCGAAMQGKQDSLILHCYNCESCWAEKNSKFVRVPYTLVAGTRPNAVGLPFWRITTEAAGLRMQTMADLLKATNQPLVITRNHQERHLEFWLPAMKLRPNVFLKLAKGATLSQTRFPEGDRRLHKPLYPVTMPLKEAIQALKSLVAAMAVNKKEVLPKLGGLSFDVKQTSLAYLPFENTGHDLVHEHSTLSVPASVLRTGRKL